MALLIPTQPQDLLVLVPFLIILLMLGTVEVRWYCTSNLATLNTADLVEDIVQE